MCPCSQEKDRYDKYKSLRVLFTFVTTWGFFLSLIFLISIIFFVFVFRTRENLFAPPPTPPDDLPSTHCVAAGVQTGCGPWSWCCSSSGGCGTDAGTLWSSPSSRHRWPASPEDVGGTAAAACWPDQGCCRTSPVSPGCPCTCRAEGHVDVTVSWAEGRWRNETEMLYYI